MINNISWANYCFAIVCILIIYYSVVLFGYYKDDIIKLVVCQLIPSAFPAVSGELEVHRDFTFPTMSNPDQDDLIVQGIAVSQLHIQTFLDELEAYFQQAETIKINKKDLTLAIRRVLLKHKTDAVFFHRTFINKIIQMHSIKDCSIHLSDVDMDMLWEK